MIVQITPEVSAKLCGFSPDGVYLWGASGESILVRSVEAAGEAGAFVVQLRCLDAVEDVAWGDACSLLVASVRVRGVVQVFDVRSGEVVYTIDEGAGGLRWAGWATHDTVATVNDACTRMTFWHLTDTCTPLSYVSFPKPLHPSGMTVFFARTDSHLLYTSKPPREQERLHISDLTALGEVSRQADTFCLPSGIVEVLAIVPLDVVQGDYSSAETKVLAEVQNLAGECAPRTQGDAGAGSSAPCFVVLDAGTKDVVVALCSQRGALLKRFSGTSRGGKAHPGGIAAHHVSRDGAFLYITTKMMCTIVLELITLGEVAVFAPDMHLNTTLLTANPAGQFAAPVQLSAVLSEAKRGSMPAFVVPCESADGVYVACCVQGSLVLVVRSADLAVVCALRLASDVRSLVWCCRYESPTLAIATQDAALHLWTPSACSTIPLSKGSGEASAGGAGKHKDLHPSSVQCRPQSDTGLLLLHDTTRGVMSLAVR